MHQSTTPSLSQTIWPRWASRQFHTLSIVQTLLPVTFGYSLSSRKNLEAVVMRQLGRWKRLWRRSLPHSHKRTSMGPSRSCCNGTTSALQPEEISSKGTRVSWVYYQWKCPYEKSLETYLMNLVCVYIYIYKEKKTLPNRLLIWPPTKSNFHTVKPKTNILFHTGWRQRWCTNIPNEYFFIKPTQECKPAYQKLRKKQITIYRLRVSLTRLHTPFYSKQKELAQSVSFALLSFFNCTSTFWGYIMP